jgi:hypothetical protein
MRPQWLMVCLLVIPTVGCHKSFLSSDEGSCYPRHCATEQVEEYAPVRRKVIVESESQAQSVPPQTTTPALPQNVPAMPQALPGMPMMPYGYPPMMPQAQQATVREETGIGFVFDSIKIPIPCLRFISVPKPAEVTYKIPPQQAMGYGYPQMAYPPMMPYGYPMQPGFAPQMMMPQAMPQNCMPQGQLTAQQIAQLLQAQQQGVGQNQAQAQTTDDQQIEDLLRKCEELKRLKQIRAAATAATAESKKVEAEAKKAEAEPKKE